MFFYKLLIKTMDYKLKQELDTNQLQKQYIKKS